VKKKVNKEWRIPYIIDSSRVKKVRPWR